MWQWSSCGPELTTKNNFSARLMFWCNGEQLKCIVLLLSNGAAMTRAQLRSVLDVIYYARDLKVPCSPDGRPDHQHIPRPPTRDTVHLCCSNAMFEPCMFCGRYC